jgi:hypothetical protein
MSNNVDLPIEVPYDMSRYRLWRNTTVATTGVGSKATLAPHTVGYEANEDLDNGFRRPGLIRVSQTTGPTPEYLRDFGTVVTPGTTTHTMTLYKAASGALVFSAGSIQFAWGLDDSHDGVAEPPDVRMQQMVVNLFADMGAQPLTRMSTLVAASASTDTFAPTAAISSPAAGSAMANGTRVTVSGTATDYGGGRVAGVEVSVDGATWHPATGTGSWSYSFYAAGVKSLTVRARAVDDSGNLGTSPTSRTFTLTGDNTMLGQRTPEIAATTDPDPVELGVKFTPTVDGFVKGIRFYKGTGNTGSHTGSLWTRTGTRLATVTFGAETATGWQTALFATPVEVTAGVTYVASYFAPAGRYASTPYFFSTGDFTAGPLTAPKSTPSNGNGVFRYNGGFPELTFNGANYFVDVVFADAGSTPPSVVSTTPTAGEPNVALTARPSARFSKAMNTVTFTLRDAANATVAGTTAYDSATRTATFTPSAKLALAQQYRATVTGTDTNGATLATPYTWTFTTDKYASVQTLFAENAVPANAAVADGGAVELGMKFVPAEAGKVIGVRFYRGPGNNGTHVGTLWSGTGTQLARVTFPEPNGTGWQYARFATPVDVVAGTTYVISYWAPTGNYSSTNGFFATEFVNGPLRAPAGENGVFRYGANDFPTTSYESTNYWVDPLFVANSSNPPPPPPTVSLFAPTYVPQYPSWYDFRAVEVGVKFRSDVPGVVTGVKFYKGSDNTGTHTGSLWTVTGTRLATGTFTNETATGWQTLTFATPVRIEPGVLYVASYRAPVGRYAVTVNGFASTYSKVPLHVPSYGGQYLYGSGFPANSSPHNFGVDLVFAPDPAGS